MKRIILLGFPKSGTSSFQSLLKSINYKTIHWILNKKDYPLIYQQILDDGYVLTEIEKKREGALLGNIIRFNKNNNNKLLKYLDDFSITEISCSSDQDNAYWPQLFDYKRLISENKDAYFILNWREFDLWYDSMVRWNKYNERLVNHYKKVEEKFETYELDNYYKLFKIHSIHYINIVSYFKNNPNLKMCIYDIMRDNVSKLEEFLNIKNLNLKEMLILPTNNYNLNNNFIFMWKF